MLRVGATPLTRLISSTGLQFRVQVVKSPCEVSVIAETFFIAQKDPSFLTGLLNNGDIIL